MQDVAVPNDSVPLLSSTRGSTLLEHPRAMYIVAIGAPEAETFSIVSCAPPPPPPQGAPVELSRLVVSATGTSVRGLAGKRAGYPPELIFPARPPRHQKINYDQINQ